MIHEKPREASHFAIEQEVPVLYQRSILLDVLFALAIAALFSGLQQRVGPVKLKVSDLFACVCIFLAVFRGISAPRVSSGLLLTLFAYLLLYIVSALLVGIEDGVQEAVQLGLALAFLFVLFGHYRTRPAGRLLAITVMLMAVILLYNIGWHLTHGLYVGWKHLNEPKTLFTVLPFLLILLASHFGTARHRHLFFAAACVAGVLILLSGERKAYIFAVLAILIWSKPSALLRYAVIGALLLPLLWITASYDKTGYLTRQIASVERALSSSGPKAEEESLNSLIDDSRPVTLSDAQREITNRLAVALWKKEPLFGIGTNGFVPAVAKETGLPPGFRMPIHGEFYRALYENGLIGLAFYAAIWIGAGVSLLTRWSFNRQAGDPDLNRIKLACLTMLLVYCSFEAAKTLTVLALCSLPFIAAIPPQPRAVLVRTAAQ